MLETGQHLYQPVRYSRSQKEWFTSITELTRGGESKLSFDVSAIMSILAFNYPCGNRTIFREIKRQPWLSTISEHGNAVCESIPSHGFLWDKTERIADNLNALLQEEAKRACYNRKEVYLLLSGGLDSRIIACVLHQLRQKGLLDVNPIGLTWGLEDSRDVQYGKAVAEILGFDWKHIRVMPECLIHNIHDGFPLIGGLLSPSHLHQMLWFQDNVSKEALVLAGSYGDSIGRAEFAGKHLLELDFHRPFNPFNLIKQDCFPQALLGVQDDLRLLHQRVGQASPDYALCEIEMQCHYMRGMISHAMNVVNNWCTLYQMFTDPKVYTYMWSLHPSRRDDSIYAALLEKYSPSLARLPWARTNKSLRGRTIGAQRGLRKEFHNYTNWVSLQLYNKIEPIVDPEWYESIGVFNAAQIHLLNKAIAPGSRLLKGYGAQCYNTWLWLASFRLMIEKLQAGNTSVHSIQQEATKVDLPYYPKKSTSVRRKLRNVPLFYKWFCYSRKTFAKIRAFVKWPVVRVK